MPFFASFVNKVLKIDFLNNIFVLTYFLENSDFRNHERAYFFYDASLIY